MRPDVYGATSGRKFLHFARDWAPLITLIFLAGIAWSTMSNRVDQKLDTIRFVSDSLKQSAVDAKQDWDLERQQVELQESLSRLSQLICYRSPNPACR